MMMTIRTSVLSLRTLAASLTLSTIAVITMMACGGPDKPNDSAGNTTTTGRAPSPARIGPTGTASARSTDPSGSADRPGPGSASVSVTTTGTAADAATPAQHDGDAHDISPSPINTATIAQPAPGGGGNAHIINTSAQVTFDPNTITDPIDRNDPGKVAAAYLLARLSCDSHSISLAECLDRAADLTEPSFGRQLMKKAQNSEDWRRQVLDTHLVVTVRFNDIAIQPSGNGSQVTLAFTRTVDSALIDQQTSPGVAAVTVEPSNATDWWVTGEKGFGAG